MVLLTAVSTASAYTVGVVVSLVFILISGMIAKAISFRPDLSDVSKRKLWFWIFAILCPIITFGVTFFIYSGIKARNAQSDYMIAMCIAAGVSILLYILIGFIASKFDKNGKLGNSNRWYGHEMPGILCPSLRYWNVR